MKPIFGFILSLITFFWFGQTASLADVACPNQVTIRIVNDGESVVLNYAAQELKSYAQRLLNAEWNLNSNTSPSIPVISLRSDQAGNTTTANITTFDTYTIRPNGAGFEIHGVNDRSVLYGVYDFIRSWGVQFYLSGDVLPDKATCSWPATASTKKAKLRMRGVHPYPDFLAGPSSWDLPQFEKYIRQLPKLGLNFFGIHQYTYEPYLNYAVDGVYARSGHMETTATREWGYGNLSTCEFEIGRELFNQNNNSCIWGSETALMPRTPDERYEMGEKLLSDAFRLAHQVGLVTAFGFEPAVYDPEFVELGKTPEGARKVMHARVEASVRAFPNLDYLWLFSDETHQGEPAALREAYQLVGFAETTLKQLAPEKKLMVGGWNVEPTLRQYDREYNGVKFGADAVFTSYGNYDPWRTVEQNLLRHFTGLRHDHAIAAWCEYDGRLLAGLQPNTTAYQALQSQLEASKSLGYFFLHWNTRLCDSNLDYLSRLGWETETPAPTAFYQNYFETRFGIRPQLAKALTQSMMQLESLNRSFAWSAQAFWLMADDWTVMGPWKKVADVVTGFRAGVPLSRDDVNYFNKQLREAQRFSGLFEVLNKAEAQFLQGATEATREREAAAFLHNRVAYFSAYLKNYTLLSLEISQVLRAHDLVVHRQNPAPALRDFQQKLAMDAWLETLNLYTRFIDDRGEKGIVVSLNQKILAGLRSLEASLKGL